MEKVKPDLIGGVVLIVISIIYFALSFQIRQIGLIAISSAFIPRISATGLFLLACAMVIRSVRRLKEGSEEKENVQTSQEKMDNRMRHLAALAAFISLGIGIFLMKHIGFVVGMAVYLILSFFFMSKYEKKNWILFIVLAIVIPAIIYLIFTRAFNLRLPEGIFDMGGGLL